MLMMASKNGHGDVVTLLLDLKPEVDLQDNVSFV